MYHRVIVQMSSQLCNSLRLAEREGHATRERLDEAVTEKFQYKSNTGGSAGPVIDAVESTASIASENDWLASLTGNVKLRADD